MYNKEKCTMEFVAINTLGKATYSYNTCKEIKNCSEWDFDVPPLKTVYVVEGPQAVKHAEHRGVKLAFYNLNEGVYYIFRWNVHHTKLVPIRVTRSVKTKRNHLKTMERFHKYDYLDY